MTLPLFESYREIPLTRGLVAKVDAEDYDKVSSFRWCALQSRDTFYAYRVKVIDGKRTAIYMYRFVMSENDKVIVIDHINHDTLDNRKSNLRRATNAQNHHNQKMLRTNKLGLKGIYATKRGRPFEALIRFNGKNIHIGRFDDPVEAARAYDRKAVELFGEFAYVNFPEAN